MRELLLTRFLSLILVFRFGGGFILHVRFVGGGAFIAYPFYWRLGKCVKSIVV
jgi:hypothetical protein